MASFYGLPAVMMLGLFYAVPAHAAGEQPLSEAWENLREEARRVLHRDVFRIISWNVQTFGTNVRPQRLRAYQSVLGHLFSTERSAKIFAVQELINAGGAESLGSLLPGGSSRWKTSFQDTNDTMDNGFYAHSGTEVHCERFVIPNDPARSLHPVRSAHMHVGDFDFTLLSLHLRYGDRKEQLTAEELRHILRWLSDYLQSPGADPDVILAGDFNLPTDRGRQTGQTVTLEEVIAEFPLLAPAPGPWSRPSELLALVDEKTSRHQGSPVNNFDHFVLTRDVADEEYLRGSAGPVPPNYIHAVERERGVTLSDHYPISAAFIARGQGGDGRTIQRDGCFCD